jgi:hypothetical protein
MHGAHGSFFEIRCEIYLRNDRLQSMRSKFILTKDSGEKAARILPTFQVDDKGALESGLGENHNPAPA